MNDFSKEECEKKSIDFMRNLADCNSQYKETKQQRLCTNLIYKQFNDFVQNCIINQKYNK